MTARVPVLLAAVVAALGGLLAAVNAVLLIADAVGAAERRAAHEARVLALREATRSNWQHASALQAEYDRHRDWSLRRQRHNQTRAWVLLVAASVFLLGARWLHTLCRPRASIAAPRTPMPASRPGLPPGWAVPTTPDVDISAVDHIVAREGRGPEAVIPILHAIQAHYRCVPPAALHRVCQVSEITPAQITGVVSFYPQFRRTPIGEHVITVCHGTACHVAGATRISDELRRRLNIAPDGDTDAQQRFTLREVPCLGCCTLAPVVQFDGQTHGHVQPDALSQFLDSATTAHDQSGVVLEGLAHSSGAAASNADAAEIRIGLGSCCVANGSGAVREALLTALLAVDANVTVKPVGCVGMCHRTPLVEVRLPQRPARLYTLVGPKDVDALVHRHFRSRSLVHRVRGGVSRALQALRGNAHRAAAGGQPVALSDPPVAAFLGPQVRIATEYCGALDPLDLDEYLAHDGFRALRWCRHELSPAQVVELVQRSGLRGRGGAGYPTWQKWAQVRKAAGDKKYVICNGDEGDPGAFMDRMLMESCPYRVIEGLAIAAYATGATEGIFYVRAEYTLAVERITAALQRCEQRDLLNHDRGLKLRVVRGAGAFVCGEETALIATLEGQRGVPRLRPPYPAQQGLWGRPTLMGNVETFALVPWILRNGPDAFARLGTATSKGTKVFALTGKVLRGGLIEVPMGITIRQIVEEIGGGVRPEVTAAGPRRRTFKAVQIGGPSGGCLPESLADTPVDYEALAAVGAIMGSGGLVVLDDTDCMVDIARYFLAFTQDQSCGRCAPCRIGTLRMLEILERLCSGHGRPDELTALDELGRAVAASSLCGLGKTAANPVLTTLRYFRSEYEAHLAGRCPAGRCRALIRYIVDDTCTGCTLCAQHCPSGAITPRPYEKHEIDEQKCTRCDVCRVRCPEDAIRIV